MLIFCRENLTDSERDFLLRSVRDAGFQARAVSRDLLSAFGAGDAAALEGLAGVVRIEADGHQPRLAARGDRTGTTPVPVGDVVVGEGHVVIAGPCAVEDRVRLMELAHAVKEAGADLLRGGAFKPRTSPYSFQGLGRAGLEILAEASEATGLPVVTEVLAAEDVDTVSEVADLIQIGTRNMMNYALLTSVGATRRPVLLKRGMAATLNELLNAAEYLLLAGCPGVVLCERGIRAFGERARFTLDLTAVPALREDTHLPVIVDPSHGTGRRSLVPAMARAGAAAGAHGLMIEVHDDPDTALSDGCQALRPDELPELVRQVRAIAAVAAGE